MLIRFRSLDRPSGIFDWLMLPTSSVTRSQTILHWFNIINYSPLRVMDAFEYCFIIVSLYLLLQSFLSIAKNENKPELLPAVMQFKLVREKQLQKPSRRPRISICHSTDQLDALVHNVN